MFQKVRVGVLSFALALFLAGPSSAQEGGEEKADSQWAPSASFQVGEFNTSQTSSWFESLVGLQVDIRGRSWDIGVTRGRPGHSYLRLAYAEVRLNDGSTAFDQAETNVTRGVKFKGVKVERMWRLGPSGWPVAPVLEMHGGAGKLSGSVTKTVTNYSYHCSSFGCVEQPTTKTEEVSAADIFDGLEWLPILGLSVGAAADLGDRFTVVVRAYGLEFPGFYAGGVEFTYWPSRSK